MATAPPKEAPAVVDVPVMEIEFDLNVELQVSHKIKLAGYEFRVLSEPNSWNLTKAQEDSLSLFRAYIHPDDWDTFDTLLSTVRLPQEKYAEIVNALTKTSGFPTTPSNGSSTS